MQDSNGRLLAALAEMPLAGLPDGVPVDVCVVVLAVDPFRPAGPLLESLRRAGVRAVANFPTTALFDGETGETLSGVGLGAEREASFLEQAAQAANAAMAAAALRREGGGPVLVYRPAGFEEHDGILAREADGLVLPPGAHHSSSP